MFRYINTLSVHFQLFSRLTMTLSALQTSITALSLDCNIFTYRTMLMLLVKGIATPVSPDFSNFALFFIFALGSVQISSHARRTALPICLQWGGSYEFRHKSSLSKKALLLSQFRHKSTPAKVERPHSFTHAIDIIDSSSILDLWPSLCTR